MYDDGGELPSVLCVRANTRRGAFSFPPLQDTFQENALPPRVNLALKSPNIAIIMVRILATLICLAKLCLATDYYVNTSGSDTNPGTQALPWQTINNVNSTTFGPGDEILFQGGQTFTGPLIFTATSVGTTANPIVVSSYGTGLATISSTSDGIDITNTQGFL